MKTPDNIPPGEVTPPALYFNRRRFIELAVLAGSAVATGAVYRHLNHAGAGQFKAEPIPGLVTAPGTNDLIGTNSTATADNGFRASDPPTSYDNITHYNNFYEFSTDKEEVATAAAHFDTAGWQIAVGGLVRKPRTFTMPDLLKLSPPEERIYRMRCVEAWSMVIPWVGYSLSKLLQEVEPLDSAKYVAFETLLDTSRMPGQRSGVLNWPYVEGLRLDEAMHPLAILATGIYGRSLPPQDGAPIRLVVPWKYGFKGIKSIVKINLVADQPRTTWSEAGPDEYGFYANVNPEVDHPRWSQANEQRIGTFGRRPTLKFNGYADQVAHLYAGMDLRKNF